MVAMGLTGRISRQIFGFLDFWDFGILSGAAFGASNFLKPHRCKWRQDGGCVLWQWWQFLNNNNNDDDDDNNDNNNDNNNNNP